MTVIGLGEREQGSGLGKDGCGAGLARVGRRFLTGVELHPTLDQHQHQNQHNHKQTIQSNTFLSSVKSQHTVSRGGRSVGKKANNDIPAPKQRHEPAILPPPPQFLHLHPRLQRRRLPASWESAANHTRTFSPLNYPSPRASCPLTLVLGSFIPPFPSPTPSLPKPTPQLPPLIHNENSKPSTSSSSPNPPCTRPKPRSSRKSRRKSTSS